MKVRVKCCNGSAVHVPEKLLKAAQLDPEQRVGIQVSGQSMIINPVDQKKELQRMLDQTTPENLHDEVSFGAPVGREAF